MKPEGQTGGRAGGQLIVRVLVLGVLVLVVASYWWLPMVLRPMRFFAVRRVEVGGTRYLAVDDVVRGMGLRAEASVFDDLGSVEQRLESLGGIAHATVTRRLPGTLDVTVTEIEPVALAEGPSGLIALAKDARPLPYDVVKSPVDAPIIRDAERPLVEALAAVQASDLELYADIASARAIGNEVVLDVAKGRVRLRLPVDPEVVRSVSSVRRDLGQSGTEWRELDGRYRGWVVVRRDVGNRESGIGNHKPQPQPKPRARAARPPRRAMTRRPGRRTASAIPDSRSAIPGLC
ncbi:MAG TPA: FtsQ-type POTRA domain-containing protein [Gemmatimonadales bacterium]|jgi:hypothetical protein